MMQQGIKVGISGVRGIVGESFTPQLAAAFAQAFGAFVGRGGVVVGRDTRPSGPMVEYAVVAGLQSVGCKPLLAGVVPTPSALVLTPTLGARGGIVITASHNPSEWNALKFVDHRGRFLDQIRADELLDIYHQQDFPLVQEADLPSTETVAFPVEEHFRRVLAYVDRAAIRKARFKVAVDCCNGVGALYSAPLLRDPLGCRVQALFDRATGDFERPPEPLPENLRSLCEMVRSTGADIGFAQDPDGDRLAVVDERGEPIGEDLTLALAARQVLTRHGRGPVVMNLSTSKGVEHVAEQCGSEVLRSKIGEVHVVDAMLQHRAVVGGESNGGVIIPAVHPCRDSFAAMAVILELLAVTGKTVSALRSEIPRYYTVKHKVALRPEQSPGVLRALRRAYQDYPTLLLDGVYVDFGGSWVHARRSNTEPVIRVTAEAGSPAEADRLASQVLGRIDAALKEN